MALSEDQRAMLRLLAQREQGYDDIAALMGLSVDEVRARVEEALAELEREKEEATAAPPPPPEPVPPAAAPEPEAPPAESPTPAEPVPKPPADPEPQPRRPSPVGAATREWETPKSSPPSRRPRLSLPRDPGARAALAAGAAALIAIVVVLIVGGGGDGGETTSAAETPSSSGQPTAANGDGTEPTQAILEPVDGGGASGKATFGNLEENLAMLVEAEGLKATGKGESYAIWLAESPQRMVPVGEIELKEGEKLSTQVPLPVELLAFIANETFTEVAITRANSSRLEKSVKKATEDEKAPTYTGETVLRGDVTGPIVGAELPEGESE